MAVYDPTVTATKAAAMIEESGMLNASGKPVGADAPSGDFGYHTKGYIDARRTKRNRIDDGIAPELEEVAESMKKRVRIFNVGPFAHPRPCGSAGIFYIPACPEDQEYIEMITPLYRTQKEIYPKTRHNGPKALYDSGKAYANEILGLGRGQHKSNSLVRVGVFVAAGDVPTKKELDDAKAQIYAYASEQIALMDKIWDRDRKLAYDMFRPETFGACARVLNLTGKDKPWLAQGAPSDKVKCEWCQEPVDPSAPICANCKNPVNEEAYMAMMAKKEALQAATAPKKEK